MIKFKTTYNIFFLLLLGIIFNSCTEPYILETNTYEEALVVEATITNELKKQEITLTKTSRFEDKETKAESGADVFITDNAGNRYDFEENSGKYVSTVEFQAAPGREYRLNINTLDGRTFESSIEKLTNINPMQNVTATVEQKDSLRGVAIRVNSFDPNNRSKYYRYEYEETYKIVAPKWADTKAILNNNGSISFVPNRTDIRICYSSKKNTEILLENTNMQNEDRVNFLARFISDQNYIITTRYSILVKQYVESLAAFNYYKTLKKISGSGSLLYPNQPGILLGNINPVSNPNNKVIGYFDVASVSTERIYFNYQDLFPNEPAPPYYTDCTEFCYADWPYTPDPCTHSSPYQEDLSLNKITYFNQSGYYFWVNTPCGDCTSFSSNIKPPFWID